MAAREPTSRRPATSQGSRSPSPSPSRGARRAPPLVPSWARGAALVAFAVFLTIWAWWPMFAAYPGTSIEDGHYFHQMVAISKASVLQYKELPLWNAFDCRGIPMWDHPENITASPIFWLTLPFSTTVTIIIWNVVHVAAGFVGMWLLVRDDLKLGRTTAMIAACFWAFAAAHTMHYAGEHEALISFLDAPILLLLWRRAERSWSYAVGTGLAFGWMVYDGATYGLPHTCVLLAIETATRVWPPKRALRVLAAAVVVGIVGLSVGASRLLPLMDQFAFHKRPALYPDVDHLANWRTLRDMYTLRSPQWRMRYPPQQYVFGEYLTYIGWLGVILCLLGMLATAGEMTWLVVVAAVLMVLMLGHFNPKAPWSLLHEHVFPFKQMRVPARFRLLLMVPISLWVAMATEKIPDSVRRFSPRWGSALRVVLVGCAFLCAGDIVGLGQEMIRVRFTDAPEQPVTAAPRFYYGGAGLTPDFIDQPRQNRAWLGCRSYEWSFVTDAPLWEGDVDQARAVDDGVKIEKVSRTHNTFRVEAEATRPSRILLNSGYDRGWQSNVGTVVEVSHQLALDLPPGHHQIRMRYWPPRLTLGFILTGLGLFGSFLFLFRRRLLRLVRRS